MQDHTSFDEEFGEFFDTEDDAVFADKTKRRSTILRRLVVFFFNFTRSLAFLPSPELAGHGY